MVGHRHAVDSLGARHQQAGPGRDGITHQPLRTGRQTVNPFQLLIKAAVVSAGELASGGPADQDISLKLCFDQLCRIFGKTDLRIRAGSGKLLKVIFPDRHRPGGIEYDSYLHSHHSFGVNWLNLRSLPFSPMGRGGVLPIGREREKGEGIGQTSSWKIFCGVRVSRTAPSFVMRKLSQQIAKLSMAVSSGWMERNIFS